MNFRTLFLGSLVSSFFLFLVTLKADDPVTLYWVGDGVEGGTTSNDWNNWENWRVGGLDVDLENDSPSDWNPNEWIPNADRNAYVIFDRDRYFIPDTTTYLNANAIIIPNLATARDFRIENQRDVSGSSAAARAVLFVASGAMNFETLFIDGSGASGQFNNKIDFAGSTINLFAEGTLEDPIFESRQTNSSGYTGTPTLLFLAEDVVLNNLGGAAADYVIHNADASVVNIGNATWSGRNFSLRDTNSVTGVTQILSNGGTIQGLSGSDRLTNLGDIGFRRTSGGTANLHDADFLFMHTTIPHTQQRSETYLHGLVRVLGENENELALDLNRTARSFGSTGNNRVELGVEAGSTLEVTSTALSRIGDPAENTNPEPNPVMLRLYGTSEDPSVARFAGDLLLENQGALVGTEYSVFEVAGSVMNNSQMLTFFDLREAEFRLTGSGTQATPQTFEVHSVDLGVVTPDAFEDNYEIGRLVVGDDGSPTYVLLVDEFDVGPANPTADEEISDFHSLPDGLQDALYLADLWVYTGSTLNIGEFNVYVDGTLLDPTDPGFDSSEYGGGLIVVPEPALFPLAFGVVGFLWYLRRRTARIIPQNTR